jgi:hypothetical protein
MTKSKVRETNCSVVHAAGDDGPRFNVNYNAAERLYWIELCQLHRLAHVLLWLERHGCDATVQRAAISNRWFFRH